MFSRLDHVGLDHALEPLAYDGQRPFHDAAPLPYARTKPGAVLALRSSWIELKSGEPTTI